MPFAPGSQVDLGSADSLTLEPSPDVEVPALGVDQLEAKTLRASDVPIGPQQTKLLAESALFLAQVNPFGRGRIKLSLCHPEIGLIALLVAPFNQGQFLTVQCIEFRLDP